MCAAIHTTGAAREREWALVPLGRADAEWPALVDALAELREATRGSHETLAVALLPPLASLRRIDLPKLRPAELRLFLARNAGRYFPGVREGQTANGIALARSSPAPYVAAVAATRLVEAVARAAQQSGWELATIVPAQAAWGCAARHRWAALRNHDGDVVVPLGEHVELLHLHGGQVTATRRLRRDASPGEGAAVAYTLDQPAAAAAAHAAEPATLELLPERVYLRRDQRRRRGKVRALVALAAASVFAAAGVQVHARYVLRQVVVQRTALERRASQATKAQSDIAAVTAPFNALGRIETGAALWSDVLADLTEALPQDASLVSFRASGDSIAIAGTSTRGGEVFERMEGAKLIDDVRPSGPIRREIRAGAPPADRFELVGRIPGAVPLFPKPKSRGGHP